MNDTGQYDKTLLHFADQWHWFSEILWKQHLNAQRGGCASGDAKGIYSGREEGSQQKMDSKFIVPKSKSSLTCQKATGCLVLIFSAASMI